MAPKDGGSGRRKSSMFRRSPLTGLTPLDTGSAVTNDEDGGDQKETKERRKLKSKRSSVFSLGSSSTSVLPKDGGTMSPMEKSSAANPRPRPTQKENGSRSSRSRPTSMFGSFGKKSGSYTEEGETENLAGTPESPLEGGETLALDHGRSMNRTVILAGEVQTSSGILSGFLKKKKEYLVLTETHLVRFKSQARAWETFPSTRPPAPKRGNPSRHASTTSIGSLHDAQSISHGSGELENTIPLEQIVTAYKLEDGKPFFTTEVVYLDEEYNGVGSVQLMLHDPGEADLWHSSIGAAAQKARLLRAENPFPRRIIDYLAGTLEIAQDYDQEHCQIYRVIRRASMQKGAKPSADDTSSCVFYMVVGLNKLHLIPLPDFTEANQHLSTSKFKGESFGLVNLVSMNVQQTDDRFELAFRTPLQKARVLELSAPANIEIGITVFKALHFLKPLWLDYTFVVGTPKSLLHGLQLPDKDESDHGNFDRTLTAYCRAYNCNPANIRYGIHWDVDDSPQWRLYSPADTMNYTAYELLAIMRSLRYNDTFRSVSFNNISLQKLHGLVDKEGQEHVAWTTLKGESIQAYYDINPQNKSLLYQEIQAIALKSRRLRRMDFTNSLPGRRPKEIFDQGDTKDPGCELLAGLATAIRAGEASVDWITMNGIELGETDFDAFDPLEPRARLRAVECSHCALNDRLINLLIRRLEKQFATLECIDISNNPGRLNIVAFPLSMGRFTRIRKLDISGTSWSSGENYLFSEKTMLGWRLEELCLSGIPINKATLECIAAYLLSDKSSSLYMLQMEQCGLTGSDVAFLMRSMSRDTGVARELEFQVSANRFKDGGVDEIVKAIEENRTPSKLVMRMIEFRKDSHFRQLLDALRYNTTIRELDISKASLVNDAEAGPETCEALRNVFAENKSLIELDISGEQARLDVARFGIGLNNALMGLKENDTLKVLRIEYQNLGLEGANTLSSVLEANKGLTHVYCEHNFITLQGFTTLVNAVAKNFVVLDIPDMASDRELALKQLDDLPKATRSVSSSARNGRHVPSSVRRTLTHIGASSKPSKQEPTPQDIDAGKSFINEKWAKELARLHAFLERNQNIAAGVEGYDVDAEGMLSDETMRPTTAMSDKGILDHVMSNTTPRIELNDPVDAHVGKMNRLGLDADTESRNGILGEENEKLEIHSEDDNNSTPTKKKPGKYGRGTHEAHGQGLLPKIEMTEEMHEVDDELFPMEN